MRNKEIKMRIQISKHLDFRQYSCLNFIVLLTVWLPYVVKKWGFISNMPFDVGFKMGYLTAFTNVHNL